MYWGERCWGEEVLGGGEVLGRGGGGGSDKLSELLLTLQDLFTSHQNVRT